MPDFHLTGIRRASPHASKWHDVNALPRNNLYVGNHSDAEIKKNVLSFESIKIQIKLILRTWPIYIYIRKLAIFQKNFKK